MIEQHEPVTHAVVPAAGRGTRFLPITKSVPKEMLPIAGRPAIEYIVKEATDAGIDDILMVTRTGKQAIEDYFDADPALEAELEEHGKDEALALINEYLSMARVHSVRQGHPKGLGHAVLQAKTHVGNHPFAVMLPDDLMEPGAQLLAQMSHVRSSLGGSVVALMKVTREQETAYGSPSVTPIAIPDGVNLVDGQLVAIDEVIEKPSIDQVRSDYAIVGRYIFDPIVFDALENITPGAGGEYQLTDAFAQLIATPRENGGGLYGVVIDAPRYDTGDKLGYLGATIAFALADPDMGPALREYLNTQLNEA